MSTDESASTQDPVRDGDRRVGAGREGTGAVLDALALAAAPQPDNPSGRPSVKRLIQADGANLVAFTFAPGQSFPDHSVAHPITVQCLSGELTFTVGGETTQMRPGVVIHCAERVTHRVDCPDTAPESSVLLLTMLTGERH